MYHDANGYADEIPNQKLDENEKGRENVWGMTIESIQHYKTWPDRPTCSNTTM